MTPSRSLPARSGASRPLPRPADAVRRVCARYPDGHLSAGAERWVRVLEQELLALLPDHPGPRDDVRAVLTRVFSWYPVADLADSRRALVASLRSELEDALGVSHALRHGASDDAEPQARPSAAPHGVQGGSCLHIPERPAAESVPSPAGSVDPGVVASAGVTPSAEPPSATASEHIPLVAPTRDQPSADAVEAPATPPAATRGTLRTMDLGHTAATDTAPRATSAAEPRPSVVQGEAEPPRLPSEAKDGADNTVPARGQPAPPASAPAPWVGDPRSAVEELIDRGFASLVLTRRPAPAVPPAAAPPRAEETAACPAAPVASLSTALRLMDGATSSKKWPGVRRRSFGSGHPPASPTSE